MCGIYCYISRQRASIPEPTLKKIQQRGPDHFGCQENLVVNTSPAGPPRPLQSASPGADEDQQIVHITLAASVLALRRNSDGLAAKQPLALPDDRGFLCWNGEAWKYDDEVITGSDTHFILQKLAEVPDDALEFHEDTLDVLGRIKGPFSFIYFNRKWQKLYYGRDCVGRRSLVKTVLNNGDVILSSVPDTTASRWMEVDADAIYCTTLSDVREGGTLDYNTSKRPYAIGRSIREAIITVPWENLNMAIPSTTAQRLHVNSPAVSRLHDILLRSMQLRLPDRASPNHPPVSILFSGGLDCSILARLAHDVLPPTTTIHLLNVAFENPRIHKDIANPYETCPDRLTARQSLLELQSTCPTRHWDLICVDIPFHDFLAHKPKVQDLIHPHDTEMDLSIAIALYFASRASPSKVLFSGLGADELFGGYQRHQLAYQRKGYQWLLEELLLDTQRLGKRNLGRDDRVISNFGREARYPFLDEDVIAWAMRVPIEQKVGFGLPLVALEQVQAISGWVDLAGDEKIRDKESVELDDKLVLRCLAKRLGMGRVAEEKKRAIQFGSRSAKMDSGRVKGTGKIV